LEFIVPPGVPSLSYFVRSRLRLVVEVAGTWFDLKAAKALAIAALGMLGQAFSPQEQEGIEHAKVSADECRFRQ
jgi:hypothetical protein